MSKVARRLAVSLIIASIMIVSFAGAAFAGGNGAENENGSGDLLRLRDGSCSDTCDGPTWLETAE